MPQFDLAFYGSQAFWMLISFGFLYLLIDNILFPMIFDVFDERKRIIAENLAAAEKANKAAELMMKNYQHYLSSAEQEASELIKQAYLDMNQNARKIELQHERKLKNKIKKAETDFKKRTDKIEQQTTVLAEQLAQELSKRLSKTKPQKKKEAVK